MYIESMTLQEMKKRKKELNLTNEQIAERSGIPLGTVQKIFSGITKSPRWDTRTALERVLMNGCNRPDDSSGYLPGNPSIDYTDVPVKPAVVKESAGSYGAAAKRQPLYTLQDYLALPEDQRVELIDGVFYDMAGPLPVHQILLGRLHIALDACVEGHPECELFLAPSDVRLDEDDYTVVQPDLYIICGREDKKQKMVSGAPDFIIEILSPSNRAHDLFRKLSKYHSSGVREYWIVDPDNLEVLVYDLEHDALPTRWSFTDTVPILISEGECEIDFSKIYERVKPYL